MNRAPLLVFSLAAATLLAAAVCAAPFEPAPPATVSVAPMALATLNTPPSGIAPAPPPWERAALHARGTSGQIRLSPPRVAKAPVLDGVIDEEVWSQAAVLDSFTHNRPIEGIRDTLGTVALVMYDDQNLYIAFHAHDDPRAVQAPVVPRDRIWQGDWVGVSLDTYNDHQRSFFLCSNPVGIQMDGVDQEGRDSDMAPDFQYSSRGHVTADGYDVEMAIPFKTLRFTPGEHVTFGFQAIRDVKRNGAHLYWAPVSRNVNNYHGQIGSLQGLAGIRPGRNIEVNPTLTSSTLGVRESGSMVYGDPNGRLGLGLKVGVTSNLIADVTVTPDFSQVEADAGVVDVNQRFAIYYPEKRPFFLEGSDIFTSPIDLVYTRRIVDPQYGGKLTGKVGGTSIGVLNASDRSASGSIDGLPNPANPYYGSNANYTIARLRQDVLKGSYVGLLAGERRQEEAYNRGLSADGRLTWAEKYSFTFQGAHSWEKERDFSGSTAGMPPADVPEEVATLDGQQTQGDAWYGELSRDTRVLNIGGNVYGYSPDFAADMGFLQRTDLLAVAGWVRPHIRAKGKTWYTGIHFPMYYEKDYNYRGDQPTDEVISLVQEVDFPLNSWAGMENVRRFIRHNNVNFEDLYRHAVWAGSERFRTIRGGALYVWGDQVVFAETVRGHDQRWEIWSDFRFGPQFDGGLTVNTTTVWRNQNNSKYADALIPRVRLSYQFTKELSLRWITELASRRYYDVNGVLTETSRTLTPDVLFSYYVRPGTVVYAGYGTLLAGATTESLEPQQASIFTKISYLWQL